MGRVLIVLGSCILVLVALVAIARLSSRPVQGIGCDPVEQVRYHVHAHLTIIADGRPHYPPAGVGIHFEHLCLYWLHTHAASGIIHIEAPHRFVPTLGNFFAIWGQALSRRQVWKFPLRQEASLRVFVDGRKYAGSPRGIKLYNHTDVTLEIGPPFVRPPRASFKGI